MHLGGGLGGVRLHHAPGWEWHIDTNWMHSYISTVRLVVSAVQFGHFLGCRLKLRRCGGVGAVQPARLGHCDILC